MINLLNHLKFKNFLVILFVGISLVVWIYKRESRKSFLNQFFPHKNVYVMIKGKNSQSILTLSNETNMLSESKLEEFENSVLFPLNGQIILEK